MTLEALHRLALDLRAQTAWFQGALHFINGKLESPHMGIVADALAGLKQDIESASTKVDAAASALLTAASSLKEAEAEVAEIAQLRTQIVAIGDKADAALTAVADAPKTAQAPTPQQPASLG